MKIQSSFIIAACLLMDVCAPAAFARTKCIAHGWDLLNVTPEEVLANASSFADTGLDGVTLMVRENYGEGRSISFSHGLPDSVWPIDARNLLKGKIGVFRQIVKYPCLGESFLNVWWSPMRRRIPWTDDASWANFATNMATAAWLAKEGGLRGLVIDNEDYFKAKQFDWNKTNDLSYAETLALARQRGREVFGAIFKEYPNAVILAFWLYSQEAINHKPVPRRMDNFSYERRRLWPSFLDGMWDVIPQDVRVVDGNEWGYDFMASRGDHLRSACDQRLRFGRVVAPEHLYRFRAQMGVGFGMYLDNYAKGISCKWYPGTNPDPIATFRDNLAQINYATEDYVWFYGERSTWVRWKGLKAKKWEKLPSWNETLPGLYDVIEQAKDPFLFATKRVRSGEAVNLVTNLIEQTTYWHDPEVSCAQTNVLSGVLSAEGEGRGVFQIHLGGVSPGDRFAISVVASGTVSTGQVCWRKDRSWNWDRMPISYLEFDAVDGGDDFRGATIVTAPAGADELVFQPSVNLDQGESVSYRDVTIIRLSH